MSSPYTFRVPGGRGTVRRARRRVVGVARARRYPLDEELMCCLELLASELITNAVQHGGAPNEVSVSWTGARVRVEVSDVGPAAPEPLPAGPEDEHGRGLVIVDALADAWGRRRHRLGKVTWFELGPGARPMDARGY
ncbi:ATP-binding protein [Streptomyces melanogenes]|uniref:ATP-binding protein n=1 Tax=Streptomyces melanogenes TaxID=67326 RepID=UPI00167C87DC|nr:ATP-binding protein [Streptomyces melanogenes]